MAEDPMSAQWSLRIPAAMMVELHAHLFPGDGDEHGAVIGASLVATPRGTRLLARGLFLAEDGVDYLPGQRGYRMLTASFVRETALICAEQGLAYIAVDCHGGNDSVGFSQDAPRITSAGISGSLGHLEWPTCWWSRLRARGSGRRHLAAGRSQVELDCVDVVARIPKRLVSDPPARPPRTDARYDRQARLFGDRGQALLADQKVAIIGAGGAGSVINEYLSRLGVGHLVVIDPDQIHPTNLPRVVGATGRDTRSWLTNERLPARIRQLAERSRSSKVAIAKRVARQASRSSTIEVIKGDVVDQAVVERLIDCDFIFLAADSMQARLVTNAVIHQYLIPGIQVGAKVQVDPQTGRVHDVFSAVRHLIPGESCLWCNQLINPSRLAEEAASPDQRAGQRYVDEVPAPSVITLNAVAASHAVNDYLFAATGLAGSVPLRWKKFRPSTDEIVSEVPRRDPDCPECRGRLGYGRLRSLPTRTS